MKLINYNLVSRGFLPCGVLGFWGFGVLGMGTGMGTEIVGDEVGDGDGDGDFSFLSTSFCFDKN